MSSCGLTLFRRVIRGERTARGAGGAPIPATAVVSDVVSVRRPGVAEERATVTASRKRLNRTTRIGERVPAGRVDGWRLKIATSSVYRGSGNPNPTDFGFAILDFRLKSGEVASPFDPKSQI
jgi:hypothetical protein